MEPLSERPGYNANPNDWVRYADHLEAEVERLRQPYHECVSWTYMRDERAEEALLRIRIALKKAVGWWNDHEQGDWDRRMAEDRHRQARLYLARYGDQHKVHSCPPGTRAMCSFADELRQST